MFVVCMSLSTYIYIYIYIYIYVCVCVCVCGVFFVCPVRRQKLEINQHNTGPIARRLFDHITGVQSGKIEDEFNWLEYVNID
jgi:hypothetical protein